MDFILRKWCEWLRKEGLPEKRAESEKGKLRDRERRVDDFVHNQRESRGVGNKNDGHEISDYRQPKLPMHRNCVGQPFMRCLLPKFRYAPLLWLLSIQSLNRSIMSPTLLVNDSWSPSYHKAVPKRKKPKDWVSRSRSRNSRSRSNSNSLLS